MRTIQEASASSKFERLTANCRAIRTAIKRKHCSSELSAKLQRETGVPRKICMDLKTRLDSSLYAFESVLVNRSDLQRIQETDDVKMRFGLPLITFILMIGISFRILLQYYRQYAKLQLHYHQAQRGLRKWYLFSHR